MIRGFKAMAKYLFDQAGATIHHDTLRKATRDIHNALPVQWDGGFAVIEPSQLLRWRKQQMGRRRPNRTAA